MYKMQLALVTGPLVPHEIFPMAKHESESTYIVWIKHEYPKRHSSYLSGDTFLPLILVSVSSEPDSVQYWSKSHSIFNVVLLLIFK